jgi:hypothetical protein
MAGLLDDKEKIVSQFQQSLLGEQPQSHGLLDFFIPKAEANIFNVPLDPKIWHSVYLWGNQSLSDVAGQYKDIRAGNNRVLVRLDLTAGLRQGKDDPLARSSQGNPPRGPALTNVHLFDEDKQKLHRSRIAVTRGAALRGFIDFIVDQKERAKTVNTGQKTANTGVSGINFPRMTEAQIKLLKEKGVSLSYNPYKYGAFVNIDGRPVKPFNGYAWAEGGRVYVLDENWKRGGIKFYESFDKMPESIKRGVLESDKDFNFEKSNKKSNKKTSRHSRYGRGGGGALPLDLMGSVKTLPKGLARADKRIY